MAIALERSSEPFAAEARIWGVSPKIALAFFVLPFSGLLLIAVDVFSPELVADFLAEDSAVEWATALAIVATAVLAAILARILWREGHTAQAVVYALFVVAAIAAAGEEISWGQRLLGVETPESVREANEQGEFNIHNLNGVYDVYVAGMVLVGLYGSVGSWFAYRFKQWRGPNWYLAIPPFFLAGAFIQLTAYRLLRYAGVNGWDYGEWCELCVAAAIGIFVALNIRRLRPGTDG